MYYLFVKGGRSYPPEFVKHFRSMKALDKFIEEDLKMLQKAHPEEKFSKRDYFVAARRTNIRLRKVIHK